MGCYNSIVIPAPIETVWETVRLFHDMSWATGVIVKLQVVGEILDDQPGAKRVLNEAFHETLQAIDHDTKCFSYTIDDGPGPIAAGKVKNYVGTVQLHPITDSDRTFAVWSSTYESTDPEAVAEFCNPIYSALLNALRQHFNSKVS